MYFLKRHIGQHCLFSCSYTNVVLGWISHLSNPPRFVLVFMSSLKIRHCTPSLSLPTDNCKLKPGLCNLALHLHKVQGSNPINTALCHSIDVVNLHLGYLGTTLFPLHPLSKCLHWLSYLNHLRYAALWCYPAYNTNPADICQLSLTISNRLCAFLGASEYKEPFDTKSEGGIHHW